MTLIDLTAFLFIIILMLMYITLTAYTYKDCIDDNCAKIVQKGAVSQTMGWIKYNSGKKMY